MCGIAGVVGHTNNDEAAAAVRSMVAAIDHRGPDANGVRKLTGPRGESATLGAVRLRIIDLDPSADQPMANADGTVWTVFNGEIYNFRELRSELISNGHRFATASDTECLVHLYTQYCGDVAKIASRLRGMFAFAIFDVEKGRLVVARDRLGIKPLYWTRARSGFAFASEQRALLQAGFARPTTSATAVSNYLAKGVFSNGLNAFDNVQTLGPGRALVWEDGQTNELTWWRPQFEADQEMSDSAIAQERIRAALQDSVDRHLVADREIGIFLSSGTDSSAVATLAARSGRQRTLTVRFPDEAELDEGQEAAARASQLGLQHTEVPITGQDALAALQPFLTSLDSPSTDAFNNWLVCRAARQAGLVVVLSGVGGDELFAGYRTFSQVPRLAAALPFLNVLPKSVRQAFAAAMRTNGRTRASARALAGAQGMSGAYHATRRLFDDTEIATLGLPAPTLFGSESLPRNIDSVTLLELGSYLHDQLLRDTDTTSTAHSLELRVPLLDDEVVTTAFSLPASVRRNGKELLARAAGLGPVAAKRTFTLPIDTWMRGPIAPFLRESLLDNGLPFTELLPESFRIKTLNDFNTRRTHWSKVWAVAVLRRWMEASTSGT